MGTARVFPRTVRGMHLLLLLVILAPLLLLQAGIYYSRYEVRRAGEFDANLELARAVGRTFETYVRDVLHQELTIGLAFTAAQPPSPGDASRLLADSVAEYPSVRNYNWVGLQGRIVASSDPQVVGLDLSDRAYVREILAGRDWAVSDLLVGRASGEPSFIVARAARDRAGTPRGMVVAAVEPQRLDEVLALERGERGAIVIVDRQGQLVYRYPEVDLRWEQRNWLAADPTVARTLAGEEVTSTFVSPTDSQERMGALTPVRSLGWVAGADRPVAEAMEPVTRDLFRDSGLFLLVGLVAFLMARAISRRITAPVEHLAAHAVTIGRGRIERQVEVSGPVELEKLADAFNRMAREIRLREEQRTQYVLGISHGLRTPLTVIQGQSQLLERALERSGLDGRLRHSAGAVVASSRRMSSMLRDLVDLMHLEAAQPLKLNREAVDLRSYVLGLRQRLSGFLDTGRIRVEAPEELPPVSADPDRLERILTNLLGNALKYSDPGTEVTIGLARRGGEEVVSVRDRGPGIPSEEMPHLFEPHRRRELARERPESVGLGLYVTRGLVQAHGGRLWVETEAGRGSTFSFSLPVAAVGAHQETGG